MPYRMFTTFCFRADLSEREVPMTEITSIPPAIAPPPAGRKDGRHAAMRQAAVEFETVFLTEMLKHSGVGRMTEGFNGGQGEAAFADMLTREYAAGIARSGRIGLAESVFQAMRRLGE